MCQIHPASGLAEWLLRRLGFAGIFWPDDRIYILAEYIDDEEVRRHELAHYRQRLRYGYLGFWWRCIWYVLRYGYYNSPFEIEARAAEHDNHN